MDVYNYPQPPTKRHDAMLIFYFKAMSLIIAPIMLYLARKFPTEHYSFLFNAENSAII